LRLDQSAGRLSKEGRGKRRVASSSSMPMEWIRDLCYDDYDESDWEWRSNSRFSRARAEAVYQLRDLYDSNYDPWEEVHEDSDSMDLEDQEAMDVSCEGFSWNDHGAGDLSSLGASEWVIVSLRVLALRKLGLKTVVGRLLLVVQLLAILDSSLSR